MGALSAPARPAAWAVTALHTYLRRKVARQFHGWWYHAEDAVAVRDTRLPLLFAVNHVSWWDGFFAFELAQALGHTFHVVMQADQLAAVPFFARCGALPLERRHTRQAYRDLREAARVLTPGQGLWIFPEGRRRSPQSPLALEAGVTRLIDWAGPVRVVPVAFSYQFVSEELPEAFAWLGVPWIAEGEVALARVQHGMLAARAALAQSLEASEREAFSPLLRGRPSVNKRFEALFGKEPRRNG